MQSGPARRYPVPAPGDGPPAAPMLLRGRPPPFLVPVHGLGAAGPEAVAKPGAPPVWRMLLLTTGAR